MRLTDEVRQRTPGLTQSPHPPPIGTGTWVLAALALALHLAPAWALKDDEKQPMLIAADQVELDEAKSTSVYVGNVQVNQGSMRLTADHVTVYHHEDRRIKYIIALGQPATYRQLLDGDQGEVQAFAKRMDYDAQKDQLVLTQDALLIQGTDRLSSERIVYDRARERMRAGGSGRVNITITPEGGGKRSGQRSAPTAAQPTVQGPAQSPAQGAGQRQAGP
jgi:lipopolysaccharide export system protein LptA